MEYLEFYLKKEVTYNQNLVKQTRRQNNKLNANSILVSKLMEFLIPDGMRKLDVYVIFRR